MRRATAAFTAAVASATRNNNPDEVELKMNRETTNYRTNIAAKRELALLVVRNLRSLEAVSE